MSKRSPVVGMILPLILAVGFVVVLTILVRQRAELNQVQSAYQQLLVESRAGPSPSASPSPGASPAPIREAEPSSPAEETVATATSSEEPRPRVSALEPSPGMFGPIQSSGMQLAGTHVAPHQGGLRATMKFHATETESPGLISVVVRLPGDADSQILDLQPAGAGMQFTDVRARVAGDGKFAIWQGNAENAGTLELALTVSGDAVADVRGTAGIGPFDLAIGGMEAVVTPK